MKSIKPTIDKKKEFPDPFDTFVRHLDSMLKKNEKFFKELSRSGRLNIPSEMKLWDSTQELPLKTSSVDIIVTSPPYVTSYEYADLHQLTLLWFGDDKKNFKNWDKFVDHFYNFKSQFIGSSFKKVEHGEFDSKIADDIIFNLYLKDKSLAENVAGYFADMKKVFF